MNQPPSSMERWDLARRGFFGPCIVGCMIFFTAGSVRFWQGWVFMGIVLISLLGFFIYFSRYDFPLLKRRLEGEETVAEQKLLMRAANQSVILLFLVPGLDHRFRWSLSLLGPMPVWLSLVAQAALLGGFVWVFWVMKTNSYASRTVTVEAGQTVIATGPYRMVRHPMYLGVLVMTVSTPLALGSWVACPLFALLIPLLIFRLLNEELVLREGLPGYGEYCLLTPYRLVPALW